jgi:hypothetical protein
VILQGLAMQTKFGLFGVEQEEEVEGEEVEVEEVVVVVVAAPTTTRFRAAITAT